MWKMRKTTKIRLPWIWTQMKVCLILNIGDVIAYVFVEASEDEEEEEAEDEDAPKDPITGERNSQLTVGYKGDRSYVVRGNNIGVFDISNDHTVKYYATISNIATTKGKEFKPKNVCRLFIFNSCGR